MKQHRQRFQSKTPKNAQYYLLQNENVETNLTPSTHIKQKVVYSEIWDIKEKIYTDQTGKLPVK